MLSDQTDSNTKVSASNTPVERRAPQRNPERDSNLRERKREQTIPKMNPVGIDQIQMLGDPK